MTDIDTLKEENEKLRGERDVASGDYRNACAKGEQAVVQLAGCLAAAEGWSQPGAEPPPAKGDYGWSPAFQATADLRVRFDNVEAACAQIEAAATEPSGFNEGLIAAVKKIRAAMVLGLLVLLVACTGQPPEVGAAESPMTAEECERDPHGCIVSGNCDANPAACLAWQEDHLDEDLDYQEWGELTEDFGVAEKPPWGLRWIRNCTKCTTGPNGTGSTICHGCCLTVVGWPTSYAEITYCGAVEANEPKCPRLTGTWECEYTHDHWD